VKPWKWLLAALLAALLGFGLGIALYGPGVLLQTPLGQTVLLQLMPSKYPSNALVGAATPIPTFTVQGFNGHPRQLPTLGRWQIINYWASWCGPCRKEMPWFNQAHATSQGRYEIIGIALEAPSQAQTLLQDIPLQFSVYHEPPGPEDSSVILGNRWGVLPYTVLIDPQGRLQKQHIGPFTDAEHLQTWLQEALTTAP